MGGEFLGDSFTPYARQALAAAVLALLWLLESFAPLVPARRRRLSHDAANLALAGINALLLGSLAGALLAVTAWAQASQFGLVNVLDLPGWWRTFAAIALFDLWQYAWHRLNHRVPLLWRFHAVHHADAELDASSGVRFHTGEMLLSFAARLAVLPLLGMSMAELALYEMLALPVVLFHHGNVRVPAGVDRALRWLIVTPRMHLVHHSRSRPETDSNFASLLSAWDRLFGTMRMREPATAIAIGLEGYAEHEWRSLPGMLAAPFLQRRRA